MTPETIDLIRYVLHERIDSCREILATAEKVGNHDSAAYWRAQIETAIAALNEVPHL